MSTIIEFDFMTVIITLINCKTTIIVVECACVVELKMFIDPSEESGLPSRMKLFKSHKIDHVPVWGLISEDVLTVEAALPEGYVDDGEEH
jgi:hypothetical protein